MSISEMARQLEISRSAAHDWQKSGYNAAIKKSPIPGRPPEIRDRQLIWLGTAILGKAPIDFRYSESLWSLRLIRQLISQKLKINYKEDNVRRIIQRLGIRPMRSFVKRQNLAVRGVMQSEWRRQRRMGMIPRILIIRKLSVPRRANRTTSCLLIGAANRRGELVFMITRDNLGLAFKTFLNRFMRDGKGRFVLLVPKKKLYWLLMKTWGITLQRRPSPFQARPLLLREVFGTAANIIVGY